MGGSLRKPVEPNSQESVHQEANRLLRSYSYLLKGVSEKQKIDVFDEMKHHSIHQQWRSILPLLQSSQKEVYSKTFEEYTKAYSILKYTGLEVILEEPFLID